MPASDSQLSRQIQERARPKDQCGLDRLVESANFRAGCVVAITTVGVRTDAGSRIHSKTWPRYVVHRRSSSTANGWPSSSMNVTPVLHLNGIPLRSAWRSCSFGLQTAAASNLEMRCTGRARRQLPRYAPWRGCRSAVEITCAHARRSRSRVVPLLRPAPSSLRRAPIAHSDRRPIERRPARTRSGRKSARLTVTRGAAISFLISNVPV